MLDLLPPASFLIQGADLGNEDRHSEMIAGSQYDEVNSGWTGIIIMDGMHDIMMIMMIIEDANKI